MLQFATSFALSSFRLRTEKMRSASKLPIPDLTYTIDRFETLVYCHFNKPTGFI